MLQLGDEGRRCVALRDGRRVLHEPAADVAEVGVARVALRGGHRRQLAQQASGAGERAEEDGARPVDLCERRHTASGDGT